MLIDDVIARADQGERVLVALPHPECLSMLGEIEAAAPESIESVRRVFGIEEIRFTSGGRIYFRRSMRGYSADIVIMDESQHLTDAAVCTMFSTAPNPHVIICP